MRNNYHYRLDGNIWRKIFNDSTNTDYEYDTTPGGSVYDSDLMTKAGNDSLTWDKNGQLTAKPAISFAYNWDGKLRSVNGPNSISLKYDPFGNRVIKNSSVNGNHKYIVDFASDVPRVLLVLDSGNNNTILNRFVHANEEILMQYDNSANERYYYLNDRLGSVRLVVDDTGSVVNSYTYDPWGNSFDSETSEGISNSFRFADYFWDNDMGMYYCIARYYDPELARFTARDPVNGKYEEPMTLHKYLYCLNNPVDNVDPTGELAATAIGAKMYVAEAVVGALAFAYTYMVVIHNDFYQIAVESICIGIATEAHQFMDFGLELYASA